MPPILPHGVCYSSSDGRGAQAAYDDDALLQFRLQRSGRNPLNEFDLLLVLTDHSTITVLAKRMGTVGPPTIIAEPDLHLFPSDALLARLSCI